jgi:hypothetical protein
LALLLAKSSRRPLRDLVAELHKKHGGDYMRVKFRAFLVKGNLPSCTECWAR